MERYRRSGDAAHTVILKIRFDNFNTHTRQKTFDYVVKDKELILRTCKDLLNQFPQPRRPVRLLGIGLSGLERQEIQLTLDL